ERVSPGVPLAPAAARALAVSRGVSSEMATLVFPDAPSPSLAPATPGAPGVPETPDTADGQGGDPVADAPTPASPPSRYIPDDALPARMLAPSLGIASRRLSLMAERGQIREYVKLN